MMALVRRIRPPYTTDEPMTSHDPPANFTTNPNPPIGTAIDDAATRDESETATDDDVEVPAAEVATVDAAPTRADWRVITPTTWTPTTWSKQVSEKNSKTSGSWNENASEKPTITRNAIPNVIEDQSKAQRTDTASNQATTVAPLFSELEISNLRTTWSNVQANFVDTPRHSVEEADKLVATVMQRLASRFATERATLEQRWDRGEEVSTEDLRVALKRYRVFFGKLLNAA
jgi:hypothetical protein